VINTYAPVNRVHLYISLVSGTPSEPDLKYTTICIFDRTIGKHQFLATGATCQIAGGSIHAANERAHTNHISLKFALSLGYDVDPAYQSSLKLPNGKIIKAIRQITANIQFACGNSGNEKRSITYYYNVFESLAISILIGMAF
jgi:hypothetical protein